MRYSHYPQISGGRASQEKVSGCNKVVPALKSYKKNQDVK